MSIVPNKIRAEWRNRARAADKSLVESLCELRDFLSEYNPRDPRRAIIIQEFAGDYGRPPATVRDWLEKITPYTYTFMVDSIARGVSFDHLEKAKLYASAKQMTPPELITAALSLGNGEGRVMTVDEMVSFALGEKDTTGADSRNFRKWYEKLEQLPTAYKWGDEVKQEYNRLLKALLEFVAANTKAKK